MPFHAYPWLIILQKVSFNILLFVRITFVLRHCVMWACFCQWYCPVTNLSITNVWFEKINVSVMWLIAIVKVMPLRTVVTLFFEHILSRLNVNSLLVVIAILCRVIVLIITFTIPILQLWTKKIFWYYSIAITNYDGKKNRAILYVVQRKRD